MTSTPVSNLSQAQGPPVLLSKTAKVVIGAIALLMLVFHWHLIKRMAMIGVEEPDWSHILIIPFISLYYVHLKRHELMATERRIYLPGFAFIYFGVFGYILGVFPIRNDMVTGYSMILTIFGISLLLLGPAIMRILWFPIAFLVFAIKISGGIWGVIAAKMQTLASTGAFYMLKSTAWFSGVDADQRGNTIDLTVAKLNETFPLNVAEACAGMRMLMAFLALGAALAFIFPRAWWQRLIMLALAAPIAIFVNALRVATLGWLHLVDPELSKGDSHLFVGMLMLIPAAGLLMLVGWCLDKCVITPEDAKKATPPPPVPFEQDPNEIHLAKRPFIIGLIVATATMIIATGVALAPLYYISNVEFPKLFGLKSHIVFLLSVMVTHIVLSIVIGLAWMLFMSRFRKRFEHALRFSLMAGIVIGTLISGVAIKAAVIQVTGLVLQKEAVPLRHGIAHQFPEKAGDWVLLHHDPKLPKSVESELGTKEYFNRFYVNKDPKAGAGDIKAVTTKTDLGERLSGFEGFRRPGTLAKVHITYYTGMLDTAPHVPEKCWVAAGQEQSYSKVHTVQLDREDYKPDPDHEGVWLAKSTGFGTTVRMPIPDKKFDVTLFSGTNAETGHTTTALYFFVANGKLVASNERVRFNFSTKDKYSYYCKVEVMFPGVSKPEDVVRFGEDLLSDLLPEVMACLPDWTEVQAGTYPANKGE